MNTKGNPKVRLPLDVIQHLLEQQRAREPLGETAARVLGLREDQRKRTGDERAPAGSDRSHQHRVLLGDQDCPRCHKFFTMSYWSGETMVQARCLSCDLTWPRPDVV